ncbi:hypothetical protein AKJ64_01970 [candidate division MSBL1 archaeon SCGC-AAA259E17]|uniref:Uncharacterized protein n=1 Tax=candidate division MSBL1 archaeon SCGC-AAA259E17 TaxID=1698263 RepID=A0A133UFC9_9EURY|nr:hypothetical protein AKJ64_01970 [candidate division MSBL1 archaeon SCGC-AAA259E17]
MIASYGIMFGLFVMVVAVFLPWIHGVWAGSADMVDLITGDNPLTAPTSFLGFFAIVQFFGEVGQIKNTVGGVPLITSGEKNLRN